MSVRRRNKLNETNIKKISPKDFNKPLAKCWKINKRCIFHDLVKSVEADKRLNGDDY